MSFSNPFLSNNQSPQLKMSLEYIQQAYFHRIQIKSLTSLYKLSVKLKKPIILHLETLPVLKYIIEHSQTLNSILQMDNVHELHVKISGYGIFNQKYQLDKICGLFQLFGNYCQNVENSLRKIVLQFPGWRTFSNENIKNLFFFVNKCQNLQEFTLNLNRIVDFGITNTNSNLNLQENEQFSEQQTKKQKQQQQYYGRRVFQIDQYKFLMKNICTQLPAQYLNKIQLQFSGWQGVNTQIMQITIKGIKDIYQNIKGIKILKLDLSGWGALASQMQQDEKQKFIALESVERLFSIIQDFDGQSSELIELDMRNWANNYKIKKFKEKFQYLNGGGKRKDDPMSSFNPWSMTGTNFFGSQLRSRMMTNTLKVQIKD